MSAGPVGELKHGFLRPPNFGRLPPDIYPMNPRERPPKYQPIAPKPPVGETYNEWRLRMEELSRSAT